MESQRWCYIIKHRLGKSHDLFRLLSKGWEVCTLLKIHCFLIDFWLPFLVGHLHLFFGLLNTCTAIYVIALLELMKSKYWSLSKKTITLWQVSAACFYEAMSPLQCSASSEDAYRSSVCFTLPAQISLIPSCRCRKSYEKIHLDNPTAFLWATLSHLWGECLRSPVAKEQML